MVSGYWNVPAHAGIRKVDSHGFLRACMEAYERQLQGCTLKVRLTSEHGTVPQRRSAISHVVRTRLPTTTDRRVALIFRGQCGGSGPPHSRFGGTKRPPRVHGPLQDQRPTRAPSMAKAEAEERQLLRHHQPGQREGSLARHRSGRVAGTQCFNTPAVNNERTLSVHVPNQLNRPHR